MASKISIYGLSGSGKSCYIYAMTQAMKKGFKFDDNRVLTVANSNLQQVILLNDRYKTMTEGVWPPGTSETTEFTYTGRVAFKFISDISIFDYRGGVFSSLAEEDIQEVEALYKSFKESGSMAFFIGTDKVLKALNGDVNAFNDISLMFTLYEKFLKENPGDKTPILFTLTKADLASPEELDKCKQFIRDQFAAFFGSGTGLIVGLTAVSLGRNLSCGPDNELIGELRLGSEEGNIHVPILFTLFAIYTQYINRALTESENINKELDRLQGKLAERQKMNFFEKIWNGGTTGVKKQISIIENKNKSTSENLSMMCDTLEMIKSKLRNGIELYIDGQLQNI